VSVAKRRLGGSNRKETEGNGKSYSYASFHLASPGADAPESHYRLFRPQGSYSWNRKNNTWKCVSSRDASELASPSVWKTVIRPKTGVNTNQRFIDYFQNSRKIH
jgi:hypothetical protein